MPAVVALDTSVIVAALLSWHEHHETSRAALDEALASPPVVLPAPALFEAYSVLTRLPRPHRVSPRAAIEALESTLRASATIVALGASQAWPLVRGAADAGIAGGRTYDLHILACAKKAHAARLLTLNASDFLALADEEIEISVPA